jgi:glycerol dehydrogenase
MSTVKKYSAAFPGKYIQAEQALTELPGLIQLLGEQALIIASPTIVSRILPGYGFYNRDFAASTEIFRGECCEEELQRIQQIVMTREADVLIGMGGGKTIDTAKIVADRAGIPVIIVPTIASTDAPCSGCAVIYSEEGVFDSVYYLKLNPQVVLVDTQIIAEAPVRFLVAGMGDALSTWFEARSCASSKSPNECGGYSTMTGLNLAKLCFDTLLADGLAAKKACEDHVVTLALDHIIEANTLLSGIGFESSGLATAHSVHNGLSMLEETHAFYHGEKVAFGVLTGLHLTGAPADEMAVVYSFCEAIGLPTTFADLHIADAGRDRLMEVAKKACAPTEGIHHESLKVTPEIVIDAMMAADAMGRERKS